MLSDYRQCDRNMLMSSDCNRKINYLCKAASGAASAIFSVSFSLSFSLSPDSPILVFPLGLKLKLKLKL